MKKTMMKITSRVALTILLALTISQIHVAGQTKGEQLARDIDEILLKSDEAKGDHGLVGTWLCRSRFEIVIPVFPSQAFRL